METVFHSEPGIDPALKTQETPEAGTTPEEDKGKEAPAPQPESKEGETQEQPTEEQVEAILEVAGLDMSELAAEYAKDGKLSDESYKELEKEGFPRAIVDAYIRGVEKGNAEAVTLAEKDVAEILGIAGGEESYQKMMQWASTSFNAEQQEAYNRAVNMGDKHIAMLAVQGMVARYEAEFGRDPQLVGGGRSIGTDSGDGFKSRADMIAAMSDKRYGRDPDYTREVEQKVTKSGLMGRKR